MARGNNTRLYVSLGAIITGGLVGLSAFQMSLLDIPALGSLLESVYEFNFEAGSFTLFPVKLILAISAILAGFYARR